jgi:hypothetical protein
LAQSSQLITLKDLLLKENKRDVLATYVASHPAFYKLLYAAQLKPYLSPQGRLIGQAGQLLMQAGARDENSGIKFVQVEQLLCDFNQGQILGTRSWGSLTQKF